MQNAVHSASVPAAAVQFKEIITIYLLRKWKRVKLN